MHIANTIDKGVPRHSFWASIVRGASIITRTGGGGVMGGMPGTLSTLLAHIISPVSLL